MDILIGAKPVPAFLFKLSGYQRRMASGSDMSIANIPVPSGTLFHQRQFLRQDSEGVPVETAWAVAVFAVVAAGVADGLVHSVALALQPFPKRHLDFAIQT